MLTRARMIFLLLALCFSLLAAQAPKSSSVQRSPSDVKALAALDPIDTHTHVAKGDPAFYVMLDRLHMHILDIAYVDDHDPYRKDLNRQRQDAENVVRASKGHASLCTTFDPFRFNDPDFPASAIQALNQDFANGAVAVKIWKNIGMELKDNNGHYVFADNPKFELIYQDIASHNRTLVAHQAEPDEAWKPSNPNGLDYSYYKENPTWRMYDKPGVPTKQQILDARDRLLAQNPKLRVVGAHLGSMEDDLEGLAQRLDRYPNFAVDTAARVVHLVVMPNDKVRAFILKYQDRVIYGTDLEFTIDETASDAVKEWQDQYARDWRYFSTRDTFEYRGHKTQGLGLPPAVLRKLYHANAVHWIPGILNAKRSSSSK
ncbi:MAG TPA: amidohydrolase family protein [Terriglobales bacterium]|nr:amidohydrolase family protein [Terriglobales bacterium]